MPEARSLRIAFAPCRRRALQRLRGVTGIVSLAILLASPTLADIAPDRAAALEHMVLQDCGSCHGLTLKGGLGRPLTPRALVHADRDTLALIILDGIPGTAMPPWRPLLTEAEAQWIAAYLKQE